jgi:hypothetical protein
MERSVALIELPTGHLLIQGIIKGESQSIMFCRDAALAVSELVQEWARQDKGSAALENAEASKPSPDSAMDDIVRSCAEGKDELAHTEKCSHSRRVPWGYSIDDNGEVHLQVIPL